MQYVQLSFNDIYTSMGITINWNTKTKNSTEKSVE